jgi:hypothetical protein
MNFQFEWEVKKLGCFVNKNNNSNVIYSVEWAYIGKLEANGTVHVHDLLGQTTLPLPEQGAPFTEFENVTKDQVYAWVCANGFAKEGLEESLKITLEEMANPKFVEKQAPWLVASV